MIKCCLILALFQIPEIAGHQVTGSYNWETVRIDINITKINSKREQDVGRGYINQVVVD